MDLELHYLKDKKETSIKLHVSLFFADPIKYTQQEEETLIPNSSSSLLPNQIITTQINKSKLNQNSYIYIYIFTCSLVSTQRNKTEYIITQITTKIKWLLYHHK